MVSNDTIDFKWMKNSTILEIRRWFGLLNRLNGYDYWRGDRNNNSKNYPSNYDKNNDNYFENSSGDNDHNAKNHNSQKNS